MIAKGILDFGRRLKGWRAARIEFRENELALRLERGGKAGMRLVLKGIIASRDTGVIGCALAGFTVRDKGSYKEIDFLSPRGVILFQAAFMEIEWE